MWKYSLSHFYFIIFLRFINCCQCNTNPADTNNTDLYIEKRQLEFDDYSTTELTVDDNMTDSSIPFETTTERLKHETLTESNENSSESYETNTELNENNSESNETVEATEAVIELTEASPTTTTTKVVSKHKKSKKIKHSKHKELTKTSCKHFKKGTAFDLEKMADVWQVAYYQLPNKLKCFKIHIKNVKHKEQIRYAKVFGNFNDTVHWNRCNLEMTSSEKDEVGVRRHFLQGSSTEKGVMENIIIDEEYCQNNTYLTLHRESADQWLVIKNLLVMRDCDTGDLVVFSKVPLQPRRDDILDALMVFGENKPNGTMACEDKLDSSWLKYEENVISQPLTK